MSTNTNPNRTVSLRDTKAVIYAEVERLRALLDAQDGRLAMQAESIERLQTRVSNAKAVYIDMRSQIAALKAKSEERPCECPTTYGDVVVHDRDCRHAEHNELVANTNEVARRCSILLKRSTQARDGRIEQYVDGEWIAVPQRVIRHASR